MKEELIKLYKKHNFDRIGLYNVDLNLKKYLTQLNNFNIRYDIFNKKNYIIYFRFYNDDLKYIGFCNYDSSPHYKLKENIYDYQIIKRKLKLRKIS